MQVELLLDVVTPREAILVVDDPEERQRQGAQQQHAGDDHNKGVLQPAAASPFILLFVLSVTANNQFYQKSILYKYMNKSRQKTTKIERYTLNMMILMCEL